jgi:hypothetical protein
MRQPVPLETRPSSSRPDRERRVGPGGVALAIAALACWPVTTLAQEEGGGGGGEAAGGGEATGGGEGGGEQGGGGGEEGEFNYDDGSGSVTIVDYGSGQNEVSRAAREGRTLTITGAGASRSAHRGQVPEYHRVVSGDTLWDMSQYYFTNPWNWPRIWSYNPEITNPNWIYPGDRIRLLGRGQVEEPVVRRKSGGFASAGRQQPGTLFLRSRGFIDRDVLETTGTIVGSREEVILLSDNDEVYVEFPEDEYAHVGEEYTVFDVRDDVRPVRGGRHDLGEVVEIFGAMRVVSYDPEENIARGVITESINPIERGYRVGPIQRRFEVVPPVQNQVDVEGFVLSSIDPVEVLGEHMVVFVDRGQEDGLLEGNRLFVRRRRDLLRETERRSDDRAGYPYEVVAELRVVEVRPRTATCLVTRSTTDIRRGDTWEMRRGY